MLGLPESDGDRFRTFIHRILEKPGQVSAAPDETMAAYLADVIVERRAEPGDDLISYLVQADIEGMPLSDEHVFGSVALLTRSPGSTPLGRPSARPRGTWPNTRSMSNAFGPTPMSGPSP